MQAITRSLTFIRQRFLVIAFVLSAVFLPPTLALAQSDSLTQATNNVNQIAASAGVAANDLPTVVGRIIYIFLGFVGTLLLVYLLYAGFLWMTAEGDPKQVEKAKQVIRQAIIGLVIITASFAITRFILSSLGSAVDNAGGIGGSGSGVGFPSSAGALGGGLIESHSPMRDARDVPRNTAIAIQFKEPVKISSLIQGYDDKGTPADLTDDVVTTGVNANSIKIYQTTAGRTTALTTAQVRAAFTADRKSFVFKPVEYLGSPTAKVNYTVELTSGLQRQDGRQALGSSGYIWQFEVSTVVDLLPPRVVSVIPFDGGRFAPNVVVQVNFNEPVDPTSASGIFSSDPALGRFINMSITADSPRSPTQQQVTGEFRAVNSFRTVEFVSDSSCGVNSCGRQVFCLPFDSSITATVKAASLSDTPPQAVLTSSGYNGVVDMAGNSLDGDQDGKGEGPGVDDKVWRFGTETAPNLASPKVRETEPPAQSPPSPQAQNLPLDHKPTVTFDSVLQASTVNSDNIKLLNNEPATFGDTYWWYSGVEAFGTNSAGALVPADGKTVQPSVSKVTINHRVYLPPQEQPTRIDYEYDPRLDQGVQNIYQNCFYPAASLTCSGPTCCNNSSRTDCGFPPRP